VHSNIRLVFILSVYPNGNQQLDIGIEPTPDFRMITGVLQNI
jgi:hypothetical protein